MSTATQKKDTERRRSSRRKSDRRGAVAPPAGGVERREELDRRTSWRRASDAPPAPSDEEFVRWAGALRSLGSQITRCVQLTEFVDEAPDLLARIRGAANLEAWEQVCALAGNLERAGLRISSKHVSHDARRVQHEAASLARHGSVLPALDRLEVTVERVSGLINEAMAGPRPA